MADVLVIGGGICGLGTALLLAPDGRDVTVLERDADPPPESPQTAWEAWERKGVAQFRQPHNFMPGFRLILEAELPDIQEALRRAGASRFDMVNPLPPFFADQSARPIDDSLWTYTARRPAGEWVFVNAVRREPRVTMRRGVEVVGFLAGPSAIDGVPHVVGVRTADGEELRADLVVDAMGRRSKITEWLTAIGARPPYEEQEDCGFTYYTRYFRGDELPQRIGPPFMDLGTISTLTLPGDNGTWSITILITSGDQPLKRLRFNDEWTRTVQACPLLAHWLDGQPITDVLAMSGVMDRYRRFVLDGTPVATGVVSVADAWACTNPSAGRGLTVGFMHAVRLRDVLRDTPDAPAALARQFDERTEGEIAPWYHAQIALDRARFSRIEALREEREPPPVDGLAKSLLALQAAMIADPDLFRAGLEYVATITPIQQILQRPDVARGLAAAMDATGVPLGVQLPGPDRRQLLEIVAP